MDREPDATAFIERFVSAHDGLRLYCRDYPARAGAGAAARLPLLCLAGLTRSSKDFHEFAREESARRRVLCPDYRGRGRSERDRDWCNYRPETYLRDLFDLTVALNLHRAVVLGTSLGGLLALGLCVVRPTLVAAVVLNDIGPTVEPRGLEIILGYLARLYPQPDWEAATQQLREVFPEKAGRDEAGWRDLARRTYRQAPDGRIVVDWDPAIAKPLATAKALPDLWPLFRALGRRPALVLRGALSNVLSPATLERMRAENPGLRAAVIAGVGHAPSLSESEARGAVAALLARVDADAPAA
ncbi:MAG: alpha/beta hydrolase [Proteobacteria bacterium]|nr:alpha/beta hydrolase [Pseudomonadota bacterium]